MQLVPLVTFRASLRDGADMVGAGPIGQRSVHHVTGGTFEGERLNGEVLPGGGDWILRTSDGTSRLDVRAGLKTDDGAVIYVRYGGVLKIGEAAMKKLGAGEDSDYGDSEFFTNPVFETGDERYAWLNDVVAVAEGRLLSGGVEYRVFEARND